MALGFTSLGSQGDTTARSTHTCGLSRAPDVGTLILVAIGVSATAGVPAPPSSVSGAGLVFSNITSDLSFGPFTAGSQLLDFSVWRSMATQGLTSSVISANFGFTSTGCNMIVIEVSGVSQSGTSGANAIASSSATTSTSAQTLFFLGPSATSNGNGWISFWNRATTSLDGTANDNWVFLDGVNYSVPSNGLQSAYTTLFSANSSNWTSAIAQQHVGVLVEVVLDTPVPPPPTSLSPLGRRFRIPEVPRTLSGPVAEYLKLVVRQLNAEGFISLFSGSDPNTSGFTGIPGNMLVNIGSASTWTRLFVQAGSVASMSTNSWHALRVAP